MRVYQTNPDGVFVGATEADESPLEPGVFHIPAGCTDREPPPIPTGQIARLVGDDWLLEEAPGAPDIPGFTLPPTPEQIRAAQNAAVMAERDRRIEAGTVINVAGHGAVNLQGRQVDRDNLSDLAMGATLRIGMGAGDGLTAFRDRDNTIHQLNQAQILDLWMQAATYVSAVYAASWALKDGETIPDDFADDQYWP